MSADGVAIWCENSSTDLLDNTFSGSSVGLVGVDASLRLKSNVFTQNGTGIQALGQTNIVFRENLIQENKTGVVISDDIVSDFGNEVVPGLNSIINNTNCGLHNKSENTIFALGNSWNDQVSNFQVESACDNAVNIANSDFGAVVFQPIPSSKVTLYGTVNLSGLIVISIKNKPVTY